MSSQPNQSLIDGIKCFQELTASDTPLGTIDIARKLQVSPVRVNRLLMTLKMIGLASQDNQKKYYPGPAVHLLAAQSFHSSKVLRTILPVLEKKNYTDRTVAAGVLWQDNVAYLYHMNDQKKAEQAVGAYPIFDAVKSSIGQMLLSVYDQSYLLNLLKNRTQQEIEYMIKQTQSARENGYIHLKNPYNTSENLAIKIFLDGIDIGLAFTDMYIKDFNSTLDELRSISSEIQCEYKNINRY